MQEFAWQGFQLMLPDAWECVKYSKSRERGECTFADRVGACLNVSWTRVKPGADSEKIVGALIGHLKKTEFKDNPAPEEWSVPLPWRGFSVNGKESFAVAVAHFKEAGYLAKLQFARRKPLSRRDEKDILSSLRWQDAAQPWRWRAFGCRVNLPQEFKLEECAVYPGQVMLGFSTGGWNKSFFKLRRLAFPEAALANRTYSDWYGSALPEGTRIESASEATIRTHKSTAIARSVNRKPWQKLLRIKRAAQAHVWVCDKELRLYCAEWEGSAAAKPPAVERVVECA